MSVVQKRPSYDGRFFVYKRGLNVNELKAFAILSTIPGLGAIKIRQLLQQFGSAEEALKASADQIQQLIGFERITPFWNKWQNDKICFKELDLIEQHGVQLIPFTSPLYPKSLLELHDHPALLYVRGNLKPQDQRSIAIVGTRQASIYGNEFAESLARDLAANGFTVVSGLARGIDTAAHRGALQRGRTLAVIGSGLANIYPTENVGLAEEICANGALISEFPMSTPPDRQNFPQRNRIVSGMTLSALLIEAPLKSGAMITMEKAFQYKKRLFALPGRVDSGNFTGNHFLIKSGKAHLIENAEDILTHFDALFPSFVSGSSHYRPTLLDGEEKALFDAMPNLEITLEELFSKAILPPHQVSGVLMSLVLKKMVKEFPGKIYKKLAAGNPPKHHN